MADKKKTNLLEESAVRHFMKIAGNGKLSDTFLKKVLKEEVSGRGKIFNPHGDDERHDNLNEEEVTEEGKDLEEEVQEEGKDLEEEVQEEGEVQEEAVGSIVSKGPGKAIESGKGLSGTGKKPTKKVQYEAKGSLTPKGPGKAIESGKGLNGTGKKPTKKVQYEEVQEEGDQLQEFGGPPGGEEELGVGGPPGGSEPPMGDEPPMGGEGGIDLQALVGAIAQAITQSTGVQVSVEGGEGDLGGEPEPDLGGEPPLGGEEAPLPDEEEPPMQETGIVGYKTEDPKARKMTSGQMQESKRLQQQRLAAKNKGSVKPQQKKLDDKQQLIETIANKVLQKLNQAAKVKTNTAKGPAKK